MTSEEKLYFYFLIYEGACLGTLHGCWARVLAMNLRDRWWLALHLQCDGSMKELGRAIWRCQGKEKTGSRKPRTA